MINEKLVTDIYKDGFRMGMICGVVLMTAVLTVTLIIWW